MDKRGLSNVLGKNGLSNVLGKKGLSGVVATLLLILLTIIAIVVVWNVVRNLVGENIDQSEACGLDTLNKIQINERYTCYWNGATIGVTTYPGTAFVSINVGEIDLDELIVSMVSNQGSKTYSIVDGPPTDIALYNSGDGLNKNDLILKKNEGQTYFVQGIDLPGGASVSFMNISVDIIPVINGKKCEVADSYRFIGYCDSTYGFPKV